MGATINKLKREMEHRSIMKDTKQGHKAGTQSRDTKQGHKVEKNGTTKKHNKNQQEMAVRITNLGVT